jgi:hypothetical protein
MSIKLINFKYIFTVIFYFFRNEKNVIEAAAQGASIAIGLVANIGANLIAFFAFLSFINAILSYLGGLVLYPELSFEVSPNTSVYLTSRRSTQPTNYSWKLGPPTNYILFLLVIEDDLIWQVQPWSNQL